MRTLLVATMVAANGLAASAADLKMIPVVARQGADYVSAAELERNAGVAIKRLPGSDGVVACYHDRCASVQGALREADLTWVNAADLAKALGFTARFSNDRRHVRFEAESRTSRPDNSVTSVGDLAPNFRVMRLDGSPLSLSEFRGRRVLIQSWGSW